MNRDSTAVSENIDSSLLRAKTMLRAAIIGVTSLCFWAGVALDATACDCAGTTVCSAARDADAVFVGRAMAFTGDVEFEVEQAFRGVRRGKITIENGPGNCAFRFTIGDRYFVYAYRDRVTGVLTTSMCSRTRALSDPHTRGDITYFTRRQHHRDGQPLLTGVVSDVTIDLAAPIAVRPRPLAGIRITATSLDGGRRRTATTRADGSYEVTDIGAGRWSVAANLPAQFEPHQPMTVTIDNTRGCAEVSVGARLDGRVSGQLLDERGQPLAGAVLQLANAAQVRAAKFPLRTIDAVSYEQGHFEFRSVGPGEYLVGVNLHTPVRPGTLSRRRFYPGNLDPHAAAVVKLEAAERRQLPPFRLPPLPADRRITIVVQAPTNDVARGTTLFLTGAVREPIARADDPLPLRLPFGASYLIEAVPPAGYRIIQPGAVRIGPDDTDKTIEFRIESP